jgi:hypothetical protein
MVESLAHTGPGPHSSMTSSRVWVPGLCLTAATVCDWLGVERVAAAHGEGVAGGLATAFSEAIDDGATRPLRRDTAGIRRLAFQA